MIHVVYTYGVSGGKSMKHAAFTEDWVRRAMHHDRIIHHGGTENTELRKT